MGYFAVTEMGVKRGHDHKRSGEQVPRNVCDHVSGVLNNYSISNNTLQFTHRTMSRRGFYYLFFAFLILNDLVTVPLYFPFPRTITEAVPGFLLFL